MKRIFFVFLFSSLVLASAKGNLIEVSYQDTLVLKIKDAQRVVVYENPANIEVGVQNEGVVVKGLNPGKSAFIVLTAKDKLVYGVQVNPKKLTKLTQESEVDYSGRKFYSNISLGYGEGHSKSDYSSNVWDYSYYYAKYSTKGQTPWGTFDGKISWKSNPQNTDIYDASVILEGDYGKVELGDQYVYGVSSLIMPFQPLQGLSWSKKWDRFKTYFFAGKNSYGNWGKELQREQRNSDTFLFGNLLYEADARNTLGVNFTDKSASALLKTILIPNLGFYGEVGKDNNNKSAYEYQLDYNDNNALNGKLRYIDVERGFYTPFGLENLSGYRGYQYNVLYTPFKDINFYYSGEQFDDGRSYVSNNVLNLASVVNNRDFIGINFYNRDSFLPAVNLNWSSSRSGAVDGYAYKNEAYALKLSKKYSGFSYWYKFRPSYFSYLNRDGLNTSSLLNSVGVKIPFLKNFSFESVLSDRYLNNPSADFHELEYDNFLRMNPVQLFDNQWSFDAYLQLRNSYNKNNSNSWRFLQFYQAGLKYHLNPDGYIWARVYRRVNDEDDGLEMDSIIDELRVEYSQNFDYLVRFGGGNSVITGIVFNDDNLNGEFDQGEQGIPGVLVRLSNGDSVRTNSSGVYTFRGVDNGYYDVFLEPEDDILIHTGAAKKSFQINQSLRGVASFGVIVQKTIHGRVFVDANNNGQKDLNENGIAKVRVVINKEVVYTDENGRFILPVDELMDYEVKIDPSSVPLSYAIQGLRNVKKRGSGTVDFILSPKLDNKFINDILFFTKFEKINNKIHIEGQYDPAVTSIIINNLKVILQKGKFSIVVPDLGKRANVKIFTSDQRSFLQYIDY